MAVGGRADIAAHLHRIPLSRRMWPISAVVVVLPFEPVMPIDRPLQDRAPPAPLRRSPAPRAAAPRPAAAGPPAQPGESTIRSRPRTLRRSAATQCRHRARSGLGSSSSGFDRWRAPRAPVSSSSSTAASPDFAIPTTTTLCREHPSFLLTSISTSSARTAPSPVPQSRTAR